MLYTYVHVTPGFYEWIRARLPVEVKSNEWRCRSRRELQVKPIEFQRKPSPLGCHRHSEADPSAIRSVEKLVALLALIKRCTA